MGRFMLAWALQITKGVTDDSNFAFQKAIPGPTGGCQQGIGLPHGDEGLGVVCAGGHFEELQE
jgi:hypothetical protein